MRSVAVVVISAALIAGCGGSVISPTPRTTATLTSLPTTTIEPTSATETVTVAPSPHRMAVETPRPSRYPLGFPIPAYFSSSRLGFVEVLPASFHGTLPGRFGYSATPISDAVTFPVGPHAADVYATMVAMSIGIGDGPILPKGRLNGATTTELAQSLMKLQPEYELSDQTLTFDGETAVLLVDGDGFELPVTAVFAHGKRTYVISVVNAFIGAMPNSDKSTLALFARNFQFVP